MSLKILVDSASDLTPEEALKLNVTLLPMKVHFGDTDYLDKIDITNNEFFEKLIESDTLPTTSQISPYDYEEALKEAMGPDDEALILTLSSCLSGCYQSACLAASEYDGRVKVFDTLNVCVAEMLFVLEAARLRDEGKSVDEIIESLSDDIKKVKLVAMLDTLEYLKKGGRINSATALAGSLLGIKPVITIYDGEVALLGKARGSKNIHNKLVELINASGGIDFSRPFRFVYSGTDRTLLDKYIADSLHLLPSGVNPYNPVYITGIGCVIGTHVGPGAVGVAFFAR
ncbi:MAG: DegV family protein [Lachnospiraceae bacterium]|nr:DegV family protein [Lachnospiraceae bacterium]